MLWLECQQKEKAKNVCDRNDMHDKKCGQKNMSEHKKSG